MKKLGAIFIFLLAVIVSQKAEAAYSIKSTVDVQNFFGVSMPASSTPGLTNQIKLYETVRALEFHLNRIRAEANSIAPATSTVGTSTPTKDVVPPAISFVNASSSASSSIITWTTNEPSDSKVLYGTSTGSYFGSKVGNANTLNHVVLLTALYPGMYYYVVESTDPAGNKARSKEYTFTSSLSPQPMVKKVGLGNFLQNYIHNVKSQVLYMFGK